MSMTDIIEAYEAGLITRKEAVEQGLVDDLDALYDKNGRSGRWSLRDRDAAMRGHASR